MACGLIIWCTSDAIPRNEHAREHPDGDDAHPSCLVGGEGLGHHDSMVAMLAATFSSVPVAFRTASTVVSGAISFSTSPRARLR